MLAIVYTGLWISSSAEPYSAVARQRAGGSELFVEVMRQ